MKSLEIKREKMLIPEESFIPQFPSFYLSSDQMKEIDSWEVGKTYELSVKVRMKSYDSHETAKREYSNACLEMVGYEIEKDDTEKNEKSLD